MKVLCVGYKNPNYRAVADYIEMGLSEMGHEVHSFDYRSYQVPGRLRDRFPALEKWDRARVNRRLRALCAELKPALFLVNGGHTLEPETIRAAKESGAKTALWTSDYPLLIEVYLKLAPCYDEYFLSGTDVVEHHRSAGNTRGRFLPFACLPDFHKPVELSEDDRKRLGCDVFFAGTPYPERVALLEAIAGLGGVELGIWGPGWDRIPSSSPLRGFVRGGPLNSVDYVKAASACRIAFNHMGYPMAPQLEELCNSRVFELLGCGAFQLVDAKRDVRLLFESGRELVAFKDRDELLAQVRHYLAHPQEREVIQRRARAAALAMHTYRHRLSEILKLAGLS